MKTSQVFDRLADLEKTKRDVTAKIAKLSEHVRGLTTEAAASRIGVTPDAVRKAVRQGRLSAFQVTSGSAYYIDPADADRYRDSVKPRGKGKKR